MPEEEKHFWKQPADGALSIRSGYFFLGGPMLLIFSFTQPGVASVTLNYNTPPGGRIIVDEPGEIRVPG